MKEESIEELIKWVKTIDCAFCALVENENDFENGIVLTAILNQLIYDSEDSHVMNLIRENPSSENTLWNFGVFITELLKVTENKFALSLCPARLARSPSLRRSAVAFLHSFSDSPELQKLRRFRPVSGQSLKKLVPIETQKRENSTPAGKRKASIEPQDSPEALTTWACSLGLVTRGGKINAKTLPFFSRDGRLLLRLTSLVVGEEGSTFSTSGPQSFDSLYARYSEAATKLSEIKELGHGFLTREKILLLMAGEHRTFFQTLAAIRAILRRKSFSSRRHSTREVTPPKIFARSPSTRHSKSEPPVPEPKNKSSSASAFDKTAKYIRCPLKYNDALEPPLEESRPLQSKNGQSFKESFESLSTKPSLLEQEAMQIIKKFGLADLVEGYRSQRLLKDPLRNGVLTCFLINRVFNSALRSVCLQPLTFCECLDNFAKAIAALKQQNLHHIAQRLQIHLESIMKGNYSQLFRIIRELGDESLVNQSENLRRIGLKTPFVSRFRDFNLKTSQNYK